RRPGSAGTLGQRHETRHGGFEVSKSAVTIPPWPLPEARNGPSLSSATGPFGRRRQIPPARAGREKSWKKRILAVVLSIANCAAEKRRGLAPASFVPR